MGATTILLTAPCGCEVYEERESGVTWGVRRCAVHAQCEDLAPEIAEYFGMEQ